MSHTTANWHWKNKNIGPWAKQWFQRELAAITIAGDGEESVQITEVTEVDGDVELGQRKSKYVITSSCIPFDLRRARTLLEAWLIFGFVLGFVPGQVDHDLRCQNRAQVVW